LASYDFCLKTTNAKNFIEFTPLQTQFNHKSWKAGILRGNMQNLARELVDTPANMMTPESFCQRIRQHLKTDGLDSLIEVNEFGPEEIKTNEMNCFLAVSQGSVVPPRLLILNYRGSKDETKTHTVIVGKGITFDS
jgi:aminopeptidase